MVGLDSTKVAFFQAFRELSQQKPISDISVTDIANLAKISKATFYRHFSDKYEAMNFLHEEHIKANNPFRQNLYEGTLNLLAFFSRNKSYYCAIADYQGQNSFAVSFHKNCMDSLCSYLKSQGCDMAEQAQNLFAIQFYCNGYCDAILRWLESGCEQATKDLSESLTSVLPLSMSPYFDTAQPAN